MGDSSLKEGMHLITSSLETPAIIILILAVILVLFQLGSAIVEFFVERFKKKPLVTKILEDMSGKSPTEKEALIKNNPFQVKQKIVFLRMIRNLHLPPDEQRLLATQLLTSEESRISKRLMMTDIIARIAPMFGLMSTLIPLGPGLIALGQGDTHALADSLLTAFDATIAGLAAAGIAFIISKIRKRWYQSDIVTLESILEGVIS